VKLLQIIGALMEPYGPSPRGILSWSKPVAANPAPSAG
jgi:hypothetical protein